MYDRRRMFALTGAVVDGYEHVVLAQDAVNDICSRYLPQKPLELVKRVPFPPPDAIPGDFDSALISELTDDEIINEICTAENGAEFNRLWNGGNGSDVSAGDLLVDPRLSSYTHGDCERIARMMACSPRCRAKYSEKHGRKGETYLDLVVDRAVKGTNWSWTVPIRLQNLATVRRTIRLALDKAKTDKEALYEPDILWWERLARCYVAYSEVSVFVSN